MNDFSNPVFVISLIYIILFGLCVGSFLNVVILRGLAGEDIVLSRSKCPKCLNKLKWYMNIPLLSYLFLKGRCAYCKEKISIQYPLIEFITAFLFVSAFLTFGMCYKLIFIYIAISLFIVMSVTDIKEYVILDYHAYILAFLGVVYSFFDFSGLSLISSISGAIFGYLFFEIISLIFKKISSYRIFGEGDSLIALGLGAFFGFRNLIYIIILSFILQFVFAIPLLIKNSIKNKKPKLTMAYIVIVFGIFTLGVLNIAQFFNLIDSFYALCVLVVSFFMLIALWVLILEIKNKIKQNLDNNISDELSTSLCALPFGPALLLSGLVCIFYLDYIKLIVKIFFNSN